MNEGYFRIPRSLTQSLTWQRLPFDYQAFFIKLLELVVFTETTFMVNGHPILLKPGQYCTTITGFSRLLGVSKSKIQRVLLRYQNDMMIDTLPIRKNTIITIKHQDTYDLIVNTPRYEVDTKSIPKRYQVDTLNKNKEQKAKSKEERIFVEDLKRDEVFARSDKSPLAKPACAIFFDFSDSKFHGIEKQDLEDWRAAYPSANIGQELLKMQQWILANPSKAKSKKLWRKFIINWLSKANEHKINKEAYITSFQQPNTRVTPSTPTIKEQATYGQNIAIRGW